MIEVEHVDTWVDYNGVWVILKVMVDGEEKTKFLKVK